MNKFLDAFIFVFSFIFVNFLFDFWVGLFEYRFKNVHKLIKATICNYRLLNGLKQEKLHKRDGSQSLLQELEIGLLKWAIPSSPKIETKLYI